jgi:iron-sulfur cluster repair protein YtfE (RIC family)
MSALAELEADMHAHVHKENSILFPRGAARRRGGRGFMTATPS